MSPGLMKQAGKHREGRLRADAVVDFAGRVERHAVLALHEAGHRLFEHGRAIVGVAAVFRLVDFIGHAAADDLRGHFVVLADAEVEQLAIRDDRPVLCAWPA